MAAEDPVDPHAAALAYAAAAAARWVATRFPDLPGHVGRFLAAEITKIVFPFVKVAATADMADQLRASGLVDVADALDQSTRQFLHELTHPKPEATRVR